MQVFPVRLHVKIAFITIYNIESSSPIQNGEEPIFHL
jgi:hypothetical protein